MLHFFKYSFLEDPPALTAKKNDYVVKLPKSSKNPTLHPCIFFAIDGKMDTYAAHDYLSITYYPRSCHNYKLQPANMKLEDNRGNDLTNAIQNSRSTAVPRCWPSFGQHGGAREIILVDDSQSVVIPPISKIRSFQDGGETDEFYQDNTANYDILTAGAIAALIVAAFRNNEIPLVYTQNEGQGATIGSLKIDSGLTINGQLKGNKFISISSGFIIYGPSMRIKLWATLWKDDELNRKRYIYGPLEREMTFSLSDCNIFIQDNDRSVREIFKGLVEKQDYPYCELYEIIVSLIRKGMQITDGFFSSMAKHYRLP